MRSSIANRRLSIVDSLVLDRDFSDPVQNGPTQSTIDNRKSTISWFYPTHLPGVDTRHEVFFHIVNPRRNVDRNQPGEFAGFDRSVVAVKCQGTRPLPGRAVE